MVFYRKYRPQKIDELDSGEIRDKLTMALGAKSIPHAFLFTGPKGLGKTSTARIVAKVLNCERRQLTVNNSQLTRKEKKSNVKSQMSTVSQGIEPCNKCDQCISIANGTSMDILEIDGASNRGIDEIRDLREKVKLMPSSARKKVYIIDEVHMLTTEAFNALLKTLEEPPGHVTFILCTTEPHKVPSTILSRCFHIQFKKATTEELVRSFDRIIKAEKIKAGKDALNLIASFSDGSFRDGVKILEEMVVVSDGKMLTKDLVEKKYKTSNINSQITQMIQNLSNKDTKKGLTLTSNLIEEGIDIEYFLNQMIQALHGDLLYKVGVKSNEELIINNLELETQDLKKLIELLSKAHTELKYAVLPQLPLELAIVEWGLDTVLKSQVEAARGPVLKDSRATPRPSGQAFLLKELIDKVKVYNHSVAGVLRGCSIKSYDNNSLVIETNFKFHKEKLDDPKSKSILAKAANEITNRDMNIEVVLKSG